MKHLNETEKSWSANLVLLPMLAAIVLLSFYSIPQTGLWLDELYSYYFASVDWSSLFFIAKNYETNMSLYYVLLRFWMFGGSSVVYIKSLSIIFAAATIFVIYHLGKVIHSKRVGLYAALLLCVNPFFLTYAQELRSYSLAVFLSSLAAFAFLKLYQGDNSWLIKLLYISSAILSLYAHLFSALVLVGLYTGFLFAAPRRLFSRHIIIPTLLVLTGISPLVLVALTNAGEHFDWIHPPTWRSVLHLFYNFISGNPKSVLFKQGALLVFLAPCVWSLYRYLRAGKKSHSRLLVYAWLIVPIVLCYAVSLRFPVFHPRYLIVCLVPLMLTAAIGLGDMAPTTIRRVMVSVLFLMMLIPTFAFRDRYSEDWQGLYATIASECKGHSALYFHPDLLRVTYPFFVEHNRALSYCKPDILPQALTPTSLVSPHQGAINAMPLEGWSQMWLILAHDEFPAISEKSLEIQRYMEANSDKTGQWEFPGNLRLVLYEPRPTDRSLVDVLSDTESNDPTMCIISWVFAK